MANPQKENGYTAIANEIMEAFSKTRITAEARCVLDFILRKTWGFNKKGDFISLSQFCLGTNLKKSNVCRSIKMLKNHNFIIKRDNKYSIIKDFSLWKPFIKRDNIIKRDNKSLSNERPTIVDTTKVDINSRQADKSSSLKEKKPNLVWELMEWSEKTRGEPFVNRNKQLGIIKHLLKAGISESEIKDRWEEMATDPFWQSKGFDFTSVSKSFDRKRSSSKNWQFQ